MRSRQLLDQAVCCRAVLQADPNGQGQNAFSVGPQRKLQPVGELLRKYGIEVLLTRDSKLNLADRHHAEK